MVFDPTGIGQFLPYSGSGPSLASVLDDRANALAWGYPIGVPSAITNLLMPQQSPWGGINPALMYGQPFGQPFGPLYWSLPAFNSPYSSPFGPGIQSPFPSPYGLPYGASYPGALGLPYGAQLPWGTTPSLGLPYGVAMASPYGLGASGFGNANGFQPMSPVSAPMMGAAQSGALLSPYGLPSQGNFTGRPQVRPTLTYPAGF